MTSAILNNVKVNTGTYDWFLKTVLDLSDMRVPSYICFANAHMFVEAWKDAEFANILNDATLVCPDGRPLALLVGRLIRSPQERVCGMDVVPDLIARACLDKLKIFFVGPNEETIDALREKIDTEFPNNDMIAGIYIPPMRADSYQYNKEIVQLINQSEANLVFVSLGCPKQERWLYNHYQEINAPLLGIGGALPVYAGIKKRAPKWMQRFALEWLYRLFQEPFRLFKRYFGTNALFIYNAMIIMLFRKVVVDSDKD